MLADVGSFDSGVQSEEGARDGLWCPSGDPRSLAGYPGSAFLHREGELTAEDAFSLQRGAALLPSACPLS